MSSVLRSFVGLGVTLFVVASSMATVNGLARGHAARRMADNPDDEWARAILMLF